MFRLRKKLREQAREGVRAAERELRSRPKPKKLSEEIAGLAARFSDGPLTLGEVVEILQGRAWSLVLILLVLPFITPVPMPLLSVPFGVAIALISLRLALGQRPWLPARLLAKPLPPGFFSSVLKFAGKVLRVMEKLLRPRFVWFTESVVLVRIHTLLMLVSALVLLLPLPVPFTNAFPAWVILLVSGGLLERDGLAILAGYIVALAGLTFFYFLGEWAIQLAEMIKGWIFGG